MLTKSNIALFCILAMMAGFLVSRVVLSIAMFLYGINALRDISPRTWLRNRWWLLGVVWVGIYGLSYFWSADKGSWYDHWQVKFPFLLLPLAYTHQPRLCTRQLHIMAVGMGLMMVASAVYTLSFLVTDPVYYINGYKQSHILPTLPKHDHIRGSVVMALYIVWALYVWPQLGSRAVKWTTAFCMVFITIYLHILAAKSGLLSLYVFLGLWGIYLAFGKKKLAGIIIVVAMPVLIAVGIRFIPTLRERAKYISFSYYMLKYGDKSGNYGDIDRLISYKIGMAIIGAHPLLGIGCGDILPEMNKYYDKWYPNTPVEGRLVPHNQFITTGLCCGLPAMLLFAVWVFMPLTKIRRNRQGFFFFVVWFILFLQLMIEPMLEVQMGVYLYLFFLLLHMERLLPAREEAVEE